MKTSSHTHAYARPFFCALILLCLALSAAPHAIAQAAPQTQANTNAPSSPAATARTPTEVAREFYRALREKRFRDALAMSIYKPAIEGLTAQEVEELRPDFEKLSGVVLEEVVIVGEQVSGETATVFGKFEQDDLNGAPRPLTLIREGGAWLVGDRAGLEAVKAGGKNYFFETRISTHQSEVEKLLGRLVAVQMVYAAKHGGTYGDLPALVREGLMPADSLTHDSTGYRIYVKLDKGGKAYTAGAEPVRYGRTGRLSYRVDAKGEVKSKDAGGKPIK